jgi:hypothetical protein
VRLQRPRALVRRACGARRPAATLAWSRRALFIGCAHIRQCTIDAREDGGEGLGVETLGSHRGLEQGKVRRQHGARQRRVPMRQHYLSQERCGIVLGFVRHIGAEHNALHFRRHNTLHGGMLLQEAVEEVHRRRRHLLVGVAELVHEHEEHGGLLLWHCSEEIERHADRL